jgi:parallel beta-helix repeat protein
MNAKPVMLGFVAVLAAGLGLSPVAEKTDDDGQTRLPGARQVIDASSYESLQAALDALPPDGGAVRLPPGVFEIDQPLRLSAEDVLLEGAGTATHIKNVNTEGNAALVIEPPEGKKSIWRIRLANFRVTGNPDSGHGIVARQVDEVFIEGVTVSYHGGHGILLDHCYEDPRICDSLITYNKQTGLALDGCHDIVVCGNQFEENLDALTCTDSFNLCMSGNNLDDHLRHGVVIENTYGSVVSGNMIEECQGTAIVLDRDCYGITLSANVIAHNSGGGIDLRDAHGCAVSANTFTIVPQRALVIGPNSGRITVGANNFSDSYIGVSEKRAEDDQAASGVVLDGTSDIALSGNLFSGLDGAPVATTEKSPRRVLLSDNVLTDVTPLTMEVSDSLVTDNLESK